MNAILIPPELEQYAAEAVAAGHYRDMADVVRAGIEMLLRRDQARAELLASVVAARDEADRVGYLSADDVATHVRETIARKTAATPA